MTLIQLTLYPPPLDEMALDERVGWLTLRDVFRLNWPC